jgi:hypothetical protein
VRAPENRQLAPRRVVTARWRYRCRAGAVVHGHFDGRQLARRVVGHRQAERVEERPQDRLSCPVQPGRAHPPAQSTSSGPPGRSCPAIGPGGLHAAMVARRACADDRAPWRGRSRRRTARRSCSGKLGDAAWLDRGQAASR